MPAFKKKKQKKTYTTLKFSEYILDTHILFYKQGAVII